MSAVHFTGRRTVTTHSRLSSLEDLRSLMVSRRSWVIGYPMPLWVGVCGVGFPVSMLGDHRTGWIGGHRSAAVGTSGRLAALYCTVARVVHGARTGLRAAHIVARQVGDR
jgi:hypothetical protein